MIDTNPVEVESEIRRLCELLEKATQLTARRARDAAVADAQYKRAWAQAVLDAKVGHPPDGKGPTVSEVEARAALQTDKEYVQKRSTEALLQSSIEAGRNIRAQLDALRSIAANMRFLLERA